MGFFEFPTNNTRDKAINYIGFTTNFDNEEIP